MHDHHRHQGHDHDHEADHGSEVLHKLHMMLEHWVEHEESHAVGYQEWADKAMAAGQDEVAKEIRLAIESSEKTKGHLKRAKAVLAATMVYKKH